MKSRIIVPLSLVLLSGFVILLGLYLFGINMKFMSGSIITACSDIIRDFQNHIHFSPESFASFLVIVAGLLGLALMFKQLISFMYSYIKLNNHLKSRHIPYKLKKIIHNHDLAGISFYLPNSVKLTAYTIGFFKPKIILSRQMVKKFSYKELEAVVLHEVHHVRNFHIWWLLISKLTSALLFFVPVVDYLVQELKLEFELASDSFVVETQKTNDYLRSSLIQNLQLETKVIPNFATPPIEKRIEYLTSGKSSFSKLNYKKIGISVVVLVFMFGMTIYSPAKTSAQISNLVCNDNSQCQTTDCDSHYEFDNRNFSSEALFSSQQ